MSQNNGVIRVGRKGRKKFAFGEDGEVFEVDVVQAFQEWLSIDEKFRERTEDRTIPTEDMSMYHKAAVTFVKGLAVKEVILKTANGPKPGGVESPDITIAEALDFIARLREQYDEVVVFFRPKSREERESPDTSEAGLRFSVEES
jgi:hypothetical protein